MSRFEVYDERGTRIAEGKLDEQLLPASVGVLMPGSTLMIHAAQDEPPAAPPAPPEPIQGNTLEDRLDRLERLLGEAMARGVLEHGVESSAPRRTPWGDGTQTLKDVLEHDWSSHNLHALERWLDPANWLIPADDATTMRLRAMLELLQGHARTAQAGARVPLPGE